MDTLFRLAITAVGAVIALLYLMSQTKRAIYHHQKQWKATKVTTRQIELTSREIWEKTGVARVVGTLGGSLVAAFTLFLIQIILGVKTQVPPWVTVTTTLLILLGGGLVLIARIATVRLIQRILDATFH